MKYGLYAAGSDGHIILGQEPILARAHKGRITVTNLASVPNYSHIKPGYGFCRMVYPSPIKTQDPPLVFATPTSTCTGKGLAIFSPTGTPGNWTGFTTAVLRSLYGTTTTDMVVGFDSGWDYHACVFGDPGTGDVKGYGLEVNGENQKLFNSSWDIVKFKGILGSWEFQQFTRSYNLMSYYPEINKAGSFWGNRATWGSFKEDAVQSRMRHAWGYSDGTVGFLLSGLGVYPMRADIGGKDHTQDSVPAVGFPTADRNHLFACTYYGIAQHPAADIGALSRFRLLTGDFSLI